MNALYRCSRNVAWLVAVEAPPTTHQRCLSHPPNFLVTGLL
jgi:hypothetical protein